MASVVAGTKYRGEFEEKIKQIIDEAASQTNVILFIDEYTLLLVQVVRKEVLMQLIF